MTDLRSRPAGYGVIRETLARQSTARPRTNFQRILGIHPVHTDAMPWYKGALGERRVANELARLGDEWTILHAVPVGTDESDIDHVAIGPAGVFTINTKHHSGAKIWVSPKLIIVAGQKTSYLRNSRHEAERATRLLGVRVHPVIAVVGADSIGGPGIPDDVSVLAASELRRWLHRQKPTLDPATCSAVVDAAVKPTTWHRDADLTIDMTHLPAFDALHAQAVESGRVRVAWALALALGAGVLALNLFPLVLASLL